MRTLKEVNDEIVEISNRIAYDQTKPAADRMKKQVKTKLTKRVVFLRLCKSYLETSPSELFVATEIAKLETRISSRMLGFPLDSTVAKTVLSKMKKDYEKQYDIPKMREQLRTLRFLQR